MHVDAPVALAGVLVGFLVGLTGMGGGALMTPILVLFFGIDPLAAVSSDLVASFFMKPVGGGVHFRRGTVNLTMVRWLALGSVPTAFAGVVILNALGADEVQGRLKTMLGVVLLIAASTMVAQRAIQRRRAPAAPGTAQATVKVRPGATIAVGAVGGLIVGMTSVGSGSLIIVTLMLLYPAIGTAELVGTNLVQAIPLVGSAALGHVFFGDLRLGLTGWLLVGCLPGVYIGARVSSRAPDHVIRPVLVVVLAGSALKLLGVSNAVVGALVGIAATAGAVVAARHYVRSRSSTSTVLITSPTVVASAASIPETT